MSVSADRARDAADDVAELDCRELADRLPDEDERVLVVLLHDKGDSFVLRLSRIKA